MTDKRIFSVVRLIIGNKPFTLDDFRSIKQETRTIEEGDITKTQLIEIEELGNGLLSIYFEEGASHPRPNVVHNTDIQKDEVNPRSDCQIERNTQTFVLIDEGQQKIFISDFRKKQFLENYLGEKIRRRVIMKNIIDRENFMKEMKQLNSIFLSASPDLFSASGILADQLKKDIYGYDMAIGSISLKLNFKENSFPDQAREKIISLISQHEKAAIEKIEVSGRIDTNFERVFNAETIVDKVEVQVDLHPNGLFDKKKVFDELIRKIKG